MKLRQVAAIAEEEAGSSAPDAMYRRGWESIKHIQMSGERSITMHLNESVSHTPACTLFAILNQLEHIEHPTTSGRWKITLDTPQYRDPATHMFTRIGLPGYYGLLCRLNSWMCDAFIPPPIKIPLPLRTTPTAPPLP